MSTNKVVILLSYVGAGKKEGDLCYNSCTTDKDCHKGVCPIFHIFKCVESPAAGTGKHCCCRPGCC